MLAGVHELTSGEMVLDGQPVKFSSPADALAHGIAMVFQETSLVPSMTVAQNIYLGDEKLFNRLRELYIQAQHFLPCMNFQVDPTALVSSLGAAQKQMVEIARAVHHKARIIIFDEPTASLTPEEKNHFFGLVRRLVKQDVSIIFISHALEEALLLADRITVLRDGELVVTGPAGEFDRERSSRRWSAAASAPPCMAPPSARRGLMAAECSACRTCRAAAWCAIPHSRSMPGRSRASSAWSAPAAPKR